MTDGHGESLTLVVEEATILLYPDGRPVVLPAGRKPVALLVLLALAPGQRLSRRLAAATLWGALTEEGARNALRVALSQLTGALRRQGAAVVGADRRDLWIDDGRLRLRGSAADAAGSAWSQFADLDPAFGAWLRARASVGLAAASAPRAAGNLGLAEAPSASPAATFAGAAPAWLPLPGLEPPWVAVEPPEPVGSGLAGLARAVQEELAGAVARLRWVRVAAPRTAAGSVVGPAGYRLRGWFEAAGDRIVLGLTLVDERRSGLACWSERLEAAGAPAAAAAEAAAVAAARLDAALLAAEAAAAAAAGAPSGYAMAVAATPALARLDRGEFLAAGARLDEAAVAAPDLSLTHALRAYWGILVLGQGWARRPRAEVEATSAAAELAVMLDSGDARALAIAGHVRAFLQGDAAGGLVLHERALAANPDLPLALRLAGVAHCYAGDLAAARSLLVRSLALAPLDPHRFIGETCMAIERLLAGDCAEAARIAAMVRVANPRFSSARKVEIAALGELGRADESAPLIAALRAIEPGFTLRGFQARSPYRRREHATAFVRGLRAAGVR